MCIRDRHDMMAITSISEEEVMTEVTRLLDAYSSVNDKINVVYKIEEYKNSFGITEIDTAMFADKGMMMSVDEVPMQEELIKSEKSKEIAKPKSKGGAVILQPANKELNKKNQKVPFKKSQRIKKE
ncbi:MAG: hypothetical protein KUG51_00845 [Urechidicola sp.]|nr:hypothetical protein [Urechidicola sp.]